MSSFSINQISKKLNKKYPYINKIVSMMIEDGILIKKVIGRSYLCSINFRNDEAVVLLTLNEINKRNNFVQKNKAMRLLLDTIDQLRRDITIHSVVWSKKELFLVVENIDDENNIRSKFSTKQKIVVLTKKFSKKLFESINPKDQIILYGYEKYFEYLQEVEDELRAKQFRLLSYYDE